MTTLAYQVFAIKPIFLALVALVMLGLMVQYESL
jgi:hypothetical protein